MGYIKIDDTLKVTFLSDCAKCELFDIINHSCKAYPNGIPAVLLMNKEKHRAVRNDQVGNDVFMPIADLDEKQKK
jgi:hypothetical protein